MFSERNHCTKNKALKVLLLRPLVSPNFPEWGVFIPNYRSIQRLHHLPRPTISQVLKFSEAFPRAPAFRHMCDRINHQKLLSGFWEGLFSRFPGWKHQHIRCVPFKDAAVPEFILKLPAPTGSTQFKEVYSPETHGKHMICYALKQSANISFHLFTPKDQCLFPWIQQQVKTMNWS